MANVIEAKHQHGESLQTHAPCENRRSDAQGFGHLWSEDTCTTEFQPFATPFDFNLKAGFGVREVSWTNSNFGITHFGIEGFERGNQHLKVGSFFHDDAFNLMEFGKVGAVDGFLAEDAVHRKHTACFGRMVGEVLNRVDRCVRAKQGALRDLG